MMQTPPTRYKVVERGRRLEVIDTWSGDRVNPPRNLPEGERGSGTLEAAQGKAAQGKVRAGAGVDDGVFVTRRWYDDKAPRTIRLNYATRARLSQLRFGVAIAVALLVVLSFWFWPLAVLLIVALASGPKLRAQLRAGSTSWIDGLDQAA